VNRGGRLGVAGVLVVAAAAGILWRGHRGNAERAVVFTTAARLSPRGDRWAMSVLGMVYEPETNSPARRLTLSAFREALGLDEGAEEAALFRERAAAFLVDREGEEEAAVRFPGSGRFTPGEPVETGDDGRFALALRPSVAAVAPLLRERRGSPGWLEVEVTGEGGRPVLGRGWIQCVPPEGITVVSDVDDTVKETNVLDRREMMANTFLRPFRAVEGMAAAYDGWAREGAVFHYLSAGPVPLQGFIEEFLAEHRFPPGELSMREFRWRPGVLGDLLFGDPAVHKGAVLERLVADFPGRRFVLVGDSGERDPEIYGAFARVHPDAVASILIREVVPGGSPPERYTAAFEGLPDGLCRVFTDPATLGPLPR
jgi:hypothetical protein